MADRCTTPASARSPRCPLGQCAAADRDTGLAIPADRRRREHVDDPRPDPARQRVPSLAVRPGRESLYAQLSNEHAVVGLRSRDAEGHPAPRAASEAGRGGADWDFEAPHHGLALTDDGRTLCLAGRASDYAALVRAPDLTLIATIPVGDAPGWAEVADGGRVCLVTNTRSDDLSIISIPGRTEIVRLPIGNGPKHITVARIPRWSRRSRRAAESFARRRRAPHRVGQAPT